MDFITLGHDCQVAAELKRRGIYPQELTHEIGFKHIRGLIMMIESNCDRFLNWDTLEVIGDYDSLNTVVVQDVQTGVFDAHNFPSDVPIDVSFQAFHAYREPLKAPFMQALREQEFLQITRTNRNLETIDEIVRLHDAIYTLRDGKKFDLYVFQDSKFMRKDWGIENLHTFWCEHWKWKDRWIGESELWDRFFLLFLSQNKKIRLL